MPYEVIVPRLGWSMDEGAFAGWLKADGETVRAGEPLFVLEADKASQEVESLDAGVLRIPPDAPQAGDKVVVGQPLGWIVGAGEPAPFEVEAVTAGGSRTRPQAPDPSGGTRALDPPYEAGGEQTRPQAPRNGPRASPRARRVARELGLDWAQIAGSGRGGRVRERDVRAAAEVRVAGVESARPQPVSTSGLGSAAVNPPPRPSPARTGGGGKEAEGELLPISPLRRTIAARMSAAARDTAPVTLTARADATNLVSLREQFRAAPAADGPVPGYTDALVKLAAAVLVRHPRLQAQWRDEGLWVPAGIHVAVAVDAEAGLLAPVVRDADRLSLRQVAAETARLAAAARAGALSAEDQSGGVFTVTNLGGHGIDAFTPIVNLPQSSILGVGRIRQEPAVVAGQVVPRWQVWLSLTFDHRVVDGAPAARFLQELTQAVEGPVPWLVS
jgi:pyruvate dehydrogenase E2 component (dihydrolipoamide acetyltransferase)